MKRIVGALVLLVGGLTGGFILLRDDGDKVASSPAAARAEAEDAVRDPLKAAGEAVEVGKDTAAGADKVARDPSRAPEKAKEVAEDVFAEDEKAGVGSRPREDKAAGRGDRARADKKAGAAGPPAADAGGARDQAREDKTARAADRARERRSRSGDRTREEEAGTGDRAERTARRSPVARMHRIRRGDNLWSIAETQLGQNASDRQIANRVVRIARINELRDPDLILAGETLRLRAEGRRRA